MYCRSTQDQIQALVVQKVNRAIHRINRYPADKGVQNQYCVIHGIEIYSVIHLSNN